MAENIEEPDQEPEEGAEEGGGISEDSGGKFKLNASTIRILKTALNYFITAIIAFLVAFMVAGSSSDDHKKDPMEIENADKGYIKPIMADWTLTDEAMMVSTADEERHIFKVKIVIKYDGENIKLQNRLTDRKTEIIDAVYDIIGSKKMIEIDSVDERQRLKREILEKIGYLVDMPGVGDVLFVEQSLH